MTNKISISEAESQVMEVLWRTAEPLVAEQVVAAMAQTQCWQAATVKTLLNRLLKKGAIAAQKDGRRFLYRAVLQREEWLADESDGFIARMFGGRIAPLLAHFGSQKKLSQADIAALRKLVDELENDQ